ncbi:MAG: phosphatase PAP2 family protein [Pseudomonadota bacterium]
MNWFRIRKQKHFLSYYVLWLPFIAIYQVTNRFHIVEPKTLPLTWIDTAIPFIPWTIPIYVSYLVYTFVVVARSSDDNELRIIFFLTHLQLVLSALFFILFPVTFPREQFYYTDPVTSLFNSFWLMFDAPANCFPSLHTILCLTAIRHSLGKPASWLYVSWGILIIISTLTCKQHYMVDLVAGAGIYLISVRLFTTYCSWRPGKIPEAPPSQMDQ